MDGSRPRGDTVIEVPMTFAIPGAAAGRGPRPPSANSR